MRSLWITLLLVALVPRPGAAQEAGTELEVEQARAEFREGVELARAERWAEAEAAFHRAHARYPEPLVLFNLAGARAQLGRLIEARATYERFVAHAREDQDAYREAAEREMAALEVRFGHLRIRVSGAEPGDRLEIDGASASSAELVPVDPGRREVVVRRGASVVARASTEVADGETVEVALLVVVPERLVTVTEDGTSPWVWVGVTAGVLAVAGGIAAAVVVATAPSASPFEGNVTPGVVRVALEP